MELKGTVVFASGKEGDYDIWTLDLASKHLEQLTRGDYWNDCPKWSPDGTQIVFISSRSGAPEIWLMDADGENQRPVTSSGKWHNTPDWSPDGKKLVFCANYAGNIDIYTMDADGTQRAQITGYKEMDFAPQFSPDGTKIIFISQRSGNDDIWLCDIISGRFTQLTNYIARDYSPVFSPDGSLIAFVCGLYDPRGRENLEVYLMDKDGGNRRRISYNRGVDRYLCWSPDGAYLMYTSSRFNSILERLMVFDVGRLKQQSVNFDREPLDKEFEDTRCTGLFCLLPKSIVVKIYPETYFGTERYPDWKY